MRHKLIVFASCALVAAGLATSPVEAQRRHGGRRQHVTVVHRSPLLWGGSFSQWYPYPHPFFGYPPAAVLPNHVVSVRLQVAPREAFVYIDGYAAGTVDDYDGVFQRLRLIPGPHEIVIYHTGHRTLRQNIYYNPGSTHTIRHTLAPLAPGEIAEPQPVPRPNPAAFGAVPQQLPEPAPDTSKLGTLSLRVQPADATVLVNGEPWKAPASYERLQVQLPEGLHRVRVEKHGFQPFAVDVDVHAGETTSFNVSLVQ